MDATDAYKRWRQHLEEDTFLFDVPCADPPAVARSHVCSQLANGQPSDGIAVLDDKARLYGCEYCGRVHHCRESPESCLLVTTDGGAAVKCGFSHRIVGAADMDGPGTFRLEQEARDNEGEWLGVERTNIASLARQGRSHRARASRAGCGSSTTVLMAPAALAISMHNNPM